MNAEELTKLMTEWWPIVIAAVLALSKLVNTATQHWTAWRPAAKLLGFLVEALDLVRIPEFKKQPTPEEIVMQKKVQDALINKSNET